MDLGDDAASYSFPDLLSRAAQHFASHWASELYTHSTFAHEGVYQRHWHLVEEVIAIPRISTLGTAGYRRILLRMVIGATVAITVGGVAAGLAGIVWPLLSW